MLLDLAWFHRILLYGHFRSIPLRIFCQDPPVDVHWYMDARDQGLAVLHPATKQYIQVRFDDEERSWMAEAQSSSFPINVREHFSIALAALVFGPLLHSPSKTPPSVLVVRVWVDNMAAVSWSNRLTSPNPKSAEINRAIGLAEAVFQFRIVAAHLPGAINWAADAGSRAWNPMHATHWTNFIATWQQVQVPPQYRKIYQSFSTNYSPTHWPVPHGERTEALGPNGVGGV